MTHMASMTGLSEDEVLQMAAAVESDSEHPLARAVVATGHAGFGAAPGHRVRATRGRGLPVGGGTEGNGSMIGEERLEDALALQRSAVYSECAWRGSLSRLLTNRRARGSRSCGAWVTRTGRKPGAVS